MKYLGKTFTVPASGKREDPCLHGWLDPRGRCVLCGERIPRTTYPPHIRYLPQVEFVSWPEDGYMPAHTEQIFPGLIDVRCYPDLEPYTLPADQAP